MLRQLGQPLRLDRGHRLKDPLINTHPSPLSPSFTPFSPFPSLPASPSLGCIETGEKMECPPTSASEKTSPLLPSSFVLVEGKGAFHLSAPVSISCSVLPIFFLHPYDLPSIPMEVCLYYFSSPLCIFLYPHLILSLYLTLYFWLLLFSL